MWVASVRQGVFVTRSAHWTKWGARRWARPVHGRVPLRLRPHPPRACRVRRHLRPPRENGRLDLILALTPLILVISGILVLLFVDGR